ncbi:MAG: Dabb family protein [Actinomycetota bacterium]
MIRHIVLTRFAPEVTEATIAEIYAGLAAVADRLPGASGFVGGRSDSPEQIERGYRHAFSIDFESWDALTDYADDPEHRALGAQLVANAIDGRDGLLVVDLDV